MTGTDTGLMSRSVVPGRANPLVALFGPLFALVAVTAAAAAVVVALAGPAGGPQVVSRGTTGQPLTLPSSATPGVTPYVLAEASVAGSATATDRCAVSGGGIATSSAGGPRVTEGGVEYAAFATVARFDPGATVTCSGPTLSGPLLVVTDSFWSRSLLTVVLGVMAVVAALLSWGAFAHTRRQRRQPGDRGVLR